MWRRSFSSASVARELKDRKWDALVVGGGHNGLTAAAYLARGGLSVAVLERRHIIGGAAVTEELIPGFKFSRCSYLQSLLRPSVIRELELARHGLKLLKRSPSSFTPCLDGSYLLLGPNKQLNHAEISKFSKRDADAYPRYENQLERFCKFMDPLLDSPTPELLQGVSSFNDRFKNKIRNLAFWASCLRQALSLGQKDMLDFMDLLLSPASKVLNNWFEGDVLKATLATDAVIGTTGSVHTPGSGYVLLHHVMGESDGDRGIWSYVEGGMGAVSMAIGNAAREAGACILTTAEVSQLMINDSGRVNGVLLTDGTQVHSSIVLSNATPYKTFMELVPKNVLPDDFILSVKHSDYSSGTTKINLAVDKLPQFSCCKLSHPDPGPQHAGTIHIGSESMEEIHSACQEAVNGLPSRRPIIEMTIPSVLDKTISPPGKHVINLFIQYTPYKPSDGSWTVSAYRESFANRCFALIDEYAPGFSSSIIGYDMLTPPDLEREIGLTGGNIFHGAMGLDSLFLMRPVKRWSNYKTPLQGLYLCGSGTHPGGGVMGAPGRNAAKMVLQDFRK
ncbi:pyridine nucleotide-disulfide oxidoreductase domain-containing protein 2 [Mangifera indica]|uniref:pyridine nucleotide-disulfide oxidoreductase domain-containing protein 2 n=1 Tax=Mangifera indica TaxID=29780 RepID=UPI001CFB91B7|nr:pyridine nucleotide-disulfide oxidoreductase domain-containing protein 2 [Mangifera indica]XP_044470205.1 pyridine nucleotide-disulfide oxidoreductase domain-containing protein 2 [Mangifera indica]